MRSIEDYTTKMNAIDGLPLFVGSRVIYDEFPVKKYGRVFGNEQGFSVISENSEYTFKLTPETAKDLVRDYEKTGFLDMNGKEIISEKYYSRPSKNEVAVILIDRKDNVPIYVPFGTLTGEIFRLDSKLASQLIVTSPKH